MSANPNANSAALFLRFSRSKLLEQYWPRLRKCVESLKEEQVWWRPNDSSNSIGNLLLHLDGNVRQWLLVPFRRLKDTRDRPGEFGQRVAVSNTALLAQLGATMEESAQVLSSLCEAELLEQFEIQGYQVSGLEAVYQVVEHFGLHYGQIIYITKMLHDRDLGFYRHLSRTGRLAADGEDSQHKV
jgi:uncharacterized damage-inducible protein DinB